MWPEGKTCYSCAHALWWECDWTIWSICGLDHTVVGTLAQLSRCECNQIVEFKTSPHLTTPPTEIQSQCRRIQITRRLFDATCEYKSWHRMDRILLQIIKGKKTFCILSGQTPVFLFLLPTMSANGKLLLFFSRFSFCFMWKKFNSKWVKL